MEFRRWRWRGKAGDRSVVEELQGAGDGRRRLDWVGLISSEEEEDQERSGRRSKVVGR
jgi:hypothetical protein